MVLFDEAERPTALAALGGASFLGLPLGPILAGWLLQHYRWGSVFLINVPLIAVALAAAAVLLPSHTPRTERGTDAGGIVLSVVGLGALTYGLIEAPVRGWGDPVSLASWIIGLGVLLGFVWWERRQGCDGLMNMRLWSDAAFAWGAGVLGVATLLGMVALFSVPLYLQGVLGVDAMGTGVRIVPMVGGILVGVVISLQVSRRWGYRAGVLGGLVVVMVGCVLASRTSLAGGYGPVMAWLIAFGFGFGALMISCQNLALSQLDTDTAGVGAATIQVVRQTGAVVGIAVLGSVLNTVYRARVDTHDLPGAVATQVRDSVQAGLAVAAQLRLSTLADSVKSAFLAGLSTQMWFGAALAGIVTLAVILAFPHCHSRPPRHGDDAQVPVR